MHLKNSNRPPSSLTFIILPNPPTSMVPMMITMAIEAAVKTL